jgi:hypothetical protein
MRREKVHACKFNYAGSDDDDDGDEVKPFLKTYTASSGQRTVHVSWNLSIIKHLQNCSPLATPLM